MLIIDLYDILPHPGLSLKCLSASHRLKRIDWFPSAPLDAFVVTAVTSLKYWQKLKVVTQYKSFPYESNWQL